MQHNSLQDCHFRREKKTGGSGSQGVRVKLYSQLFGGGLDVRFGLVVVFFTFFTRSPDAELGVAVAAASERIIEQKHETVGNPAGNRKSGVLRAAFRTSLTGFVPENSGRVSGHKLARCPFAISIDVDVQVIRLTPLHGAPLEGSLQCLGYFRWTIVEFEDEITSFTRSGFRCFERHRRYNLCRFFAYQFGLNRKNFFRFLQCGGLQAMKSTDGGIQALHPAPERFFAGLKLGQHFRQMIRLIHHFSPLPRTTVITITLSHVHTADSGSETNLSKNHRWN
jgi:hypothetical protein